jgi:hypothetical protein
MTGHQITKPDLGEHSEVAGLVRIDFFGLREQGLEFLDLGEQVRGCFFSIRSFSSAIRILPLMMEAMGLLAAKRRCSASGREASIVSNCWWEVGAGAGKLVICLVRTKERTYLREATQLQV